MRCLLLAPLLWALSWAVTTPVHACSCRQISPQDAYKGATLVFEGLVLGINAEAASEGEGLSPWVTVEFEVVRSFKGAEQLERVRIRTQSQSATCGYTFARGEGYLVYAQSGEPLPSVGLCGGTQPMREADDHLAVIGMGEIPFDPKAPGPKEKPPTQAPAQGGCASCSTTPGTGGDLCHALVAVLGLALMARRGRR